MKDGHMIDLKSCSNIRHNKRDAVHGVSYSIGDEEDWTPVIGKKKRSVPLHLLRHTERLLMLNLTCHPLMSLVMKVIVTAQILVLSSPIMQLYS